jgi:phosphomannomutase
MRSLKLSISGLRGIVGETLTPELIIDFAQAFGTYVGPGQVLIGRDTRRSGEMVRSAVIAGLVSTGCEVIDLGIVPTPTLMIAVRDSPAVGGISISAGHNTEEWNALKFISSEGRIFNAFQGEELLDVYHLGSFKKAGWDELKRVRFEGNAIRRHIDSILAALDPDVIRKRRFKVAVDCCNGACSEVSPMLLEELGCEVLPINDQPHEGFPRDPEPLPSSMSQLRALVRATGADIGFAHDSDGERLGIVTEKGVPEKEELTVCLAVRFVLGKERGPVVVNLSTTHIVEDIAGRFGSRVYRTKIGQAYVVEEMLRRNAVIGGEGSGGVIFPKVNYAHDSLTTMGLILQLMAESGKPISELIGELPRKAMVKKKLDCPPDEAYLALQRLREHVEEEGVEGDVDMTDGVKIIREDGSWVHIRASITEPIVRIIAEAETEGEAEELCDMAMGMMRI